MNRTLSSTQQAKLCQQRQPSLYRLPSVSNRNVSVRFKESNERATSAPSSISKDLADKCVNAIRFLAIDAVNKAKSGHPGMPMGMAPVGYVLFNQVMRYNPKNPGWFNRDRFLLSNGHGCMLQYALLHLTGYESMQMEDIKQLRQWDSKTPGHPERLITPGIEVTTGPLGQGICNAVGLALAEAHLAARFNKPDAPKIVDHHVYVTMSDGDVMEGMSNEACSLAGHWGLGRLIAIYDDNKISIDGATSLAFSEDVGKRYEALGWHVQRVENGNSDYEGIYKAIENAKAVTDKPSIIMVHSTIGYGSPKLAGKEKVHGAAMGAEEAAATRKALGWNYKEFEVPQEVYDVYHKAISRGAKAEEQWKADCAAYAEKYPKEWQAFQELTSGKLPSGWEDALPTFSPEDKPAATRNHSQTVLNALGPVLPGLIGGSADLATSNNTTMTMFGDFEKGQYAERNLHFGIREHGMAAISNGIALHCSGLIPYCATFFNFTDYMRAAMRMAAISCIPTIFVTTHDSIGLGEDGTTHQPIEQLTAFRAMPNILTIRPSGGNEVSGAYKVALTNNYRPTVMALSRQKMNTLPGTSIQGVTKGAYIIKDCGHVPDVILMGTGSELELAYQAALDLEKEGIMARVVSMPCWELFDEQSQEYRDSVLPPDVTARVSVEAGASLCWHKYLGNRGKHIGIDTFGASAPEAVLFEKFGITKGNVVKAAKSLLRK